MNFKWAYWENSNFSWNSNQAKLLSLYSPKKIHKNVWKVQYGRMHVTCSLDKENISDKVDHKVYKCMIG